MRTLVALVSLLLLTIISPAAAQLAGTDLNPGDSCAAFPEGAASMSASPAGDGSHITLICEGGVWRRASDDYDFIEKVSSPTAPPFGLTCTRRTNAGTGANVRTVSCQAGEILTGGGCDNTGTLNVRDNFPNSDSTWLCDMSGTTGTTTVYAICCTY